MRFVEIAATALSTGIRDFIATNKIFVAVFKKLPIFIHKYINQ
jgi:hypothetical protein